MAEQLFQIGIKALIVNEASKILLLEIPAWRDKPSYWDMPGGRMDEGETFHETLARELREEIDCSYVGEPKLLKVSISNLTVPIGDTEVGLVLMTYKVMLAEEAVIKLNDFETAFDWFTAAEAAEHLKIKYPEEFTRVIASL